MHSSNYYATHPLFAAIMTPHSDMNHALRDLAAVRGLHLSKGELAGVFQAIEAESLKRADTYRELSKGDGRWGKEGIGLSKAGEEAGTLYQGQSFTPGVSPTTNAGNMAPLVPQSMDGRLVDTTVKADRAWLWQFLPKNPVYGLFHEVAVETASTNRMLQNTFIAEGGAGSGSVGQFVRRGVTIRYEAIRDFVSDVMALLNVATPTGFVGRGALDVARKRALKTILLGRERNLWLAKTGTIDGSNRNLGDPLAYDGFYAAVGGAAVDNATGILSFSSNANQFSNLAGRTVSFAALQEVCEKKWTPNNGQQSEIRKIVMLPRAYSALVQEAQANIRYDGGQATMGGVSVKWYAGKLSLIPSYGGEVSIEAASCMYGQSPRNPSVSSTGDGASIPTFGAVTPTAASGASSQFTAADAGSYIYRITAIGRDFEATPLITAAVTVESGDVVTINIGAAASSEDNVLYYQVERTPVGASDTTNSSFLWIWPRNTAGAGSSTRIIDSNVARANCSPVAFFTDNGDGFNEWESLLPTFFKPLAQTGTTIPFLMLDFGAPLFKAPELQHLMMNAGFPS